MNSTLLQQLPYFSEAKINNATPNAHGRGLSHLSVAINTNKFRGKQAGINFISLATSSDSGELPLEPIKKTPRRGRKAKAPTGDPTSDSISVIKAREDFQSSDEASSDEDSPAAPVRSSKATVRKPRAKKKPSSTPQPIIEGEEGIWGEESKFGWPPLVVCLGHAAPEFVPAVRPNMDPRSDDPEEIATWKALQWSPPEFARTPGGPSSNVAIALGRMGARVGFMGKLGLDKEGRRLKELMLANRVMVDGVTMSKGERTALEALRVHFVDGSVRFETEKPCAADSLASENVNELLLEEARIIHVTTLSLLKEPSRSTILTALERAKQRGSLIFLDLNLPLHLWQSQEAALEALLPVWVLADVVKGSQPEIEFLVNEEYFARRRQAASLYAADREQVFRRLGDIFHYEAQEVQPLLTPNLQLLLATNGTWSVHYFASGGPSGFNGYIAGVEDVLLSAYHCDRTGSGDAMTAAFLRKLSLDTSILKDEEKLRRALRFSIAAGIVSQWIVGSVKSFPTESAAHNFAGQVYDFTNV